MTCPSRTPEGRREYWQRYRAERHPFKPLICAICGGVFVKVGQEGMPKTCQSCRKTKCKTCGTEFERQKLSAKFCSRECHRLNQAGKEPEHLKTNRGRKPRTYHATEDRRGNVFDRQWRDLIFKRDDYTCRRCGVRGGRLQAHHKKPVSVYPSLRYALSNGETVCVPCHKRTWTYGSKARRIKNKPQPKEGILL